MTRLIAASSLAGLSTAELRVLFRCVSEELACSESGTPERRIALASRENITRALNARAVSEP